MNVDKEEFIERYGEAAWEKKLQRDRDWYTAHREECNTNWRKWAAANPDKVLAKSQKWCRKGGKYYVKKLEYQRAGIQGERNKIRKKHAKQYHGIKEATPNSVLHDEWIPGTAKYRGLALVDKKAHQRGIIKVIKVLEGKITLFTEKEIREQK